MPIMNGYQASKQIRKFHPKLIIIAQSADALSHKKDQYGDIFDDYITKPIDREALVQKVKKYQRK